MPKQSVKAKTSPARRSAAERTKTLRDVENCRVMEIGVGGFAECIQAGPATCSHALPFGYCFLCMHPQVEEMIENTKKQVSRGVLKS